WTPALRCSRGSFLARAMATRAMLSRKRGLAPSSHTLMHSPESTQELAHLREASGPSPVRTMSSTPAIVACGSASAMPAAPVIGHASKHLPHLVQASSIASTRSVRAVSKSLGMGNPRRGPKHKDDTAGPGRWQIAWRRRSSIADVLQEPVGRDLVAQSLLARLVVDRRRHALELGADRADVEEERGLPVVGAAAGTPGDQVDERRPADDLGRQRAL